MANPGIFKNALFQKTSVGKGLIATGVIPTKDVVKTTTKKAVPSTSANQSVNQGVTFGNISVNNANPSLGILGGASPGGVTITQQTQNTSNNSQQTEYTSTTTNTSSSQTSNVYDYLINILSGYGSIGGSEQSVPISSNTNPNVSVVPNQSSAQTADPTQTATTATGTTSLITYIIVGAVAILIIYMVTKNKKVLNG